MKSDECGVYDDDFTWAPVPRLEELVAVYDDAEDVMKGSKARFGKTGRALIRRGALRAVVEFMRTEMLYFFDLGDDGVVDEADIEEWFNDLLGEVVAVEEETP